MGKSNVVRLFDENENVTPFPGAPVPGFVGIDYERLASALAREQLRLAEEQAKAKKAAAKSAAGAKRNKRPSKNGPADPIKDKDDIRRIAQYFHDKAVEAHNAGHPSSEMLNHRNELLFLIGCSVGLRASDLLELRVGDFKPPEYKARLKEGKTQKYRVVTLGPMAIEAYEKLVAMLDHPSDDTFLFQSQRSGNSDLNVRSFAVVLRKAKEDLGLTYRLCTHSMRKTFGYHLFMDNQQSPEILAYLQKIFGHSSSAVTLRYIGLEAEREQRMYQELDYGFTLSDIGTVPKDEE